MAVHKLSIILICDDAYVMPTVVTIKSVISNCVLQNDEELQFYICTSGITSKNCDLLQSFSTYGISVKIVTVDKEIYQKRIEIIQQKTHVTPTSLIKFEIANLLKDVDTAVYLDSDIIVKGNICELFNTNIEDNYVAASAELWRIINGKWKNGNNYDRQNFYFNSGVMYMNLALMRDNNISTKLWDAKYKLALNKTATTMDQDALNEVFQGKVVPLSIRWNLNTYFTEKADIPLINRVYNEDFTSLSDLKKSAIVLHYVGTEDKPWKYSSARCRDIWDLYYSQCGFDLDNLERTVIKHGLNWKIGVARNVIRSVGVKGLLRFVQDRIKGK